jgi:preprotein translocase subunit YajC
MIVAAWFLLIRPQQQRQKKQALMISQLTPGAEILTIGGIFGTVVELGEDRVRIAVADGSELEIVRGSIQSIVTPVEEPELDEEDETDAVDETDGTDETVADDASEPRVADKSEGDA